MTATATATATAAPARDVYVADMYTVIMGNLDNGFRLGTDTAHESALIGKTITATREVSIENGFTTSHGVQFTFTDGTSYTLVHPTDPPF